jgi:hypothetical protein
MRMIALGGLVAFVCLSVVFGTFLIVRFVMFILPSSLMPLVIVTDILRVVLAALLAYAWLRTWKMITDWYLWRSIGSLTEGQDDS